MIKKVDAAMILSMRRCLRNYILIFFGLSDLKIYLCTGFALNFKQIFNSTQYLGFVVKAGSSKGQPTGLLRLNFLGEKVMLGKR